MILIHVSLVDDDAVLRDGLKMLPNSAAKPLLARNGIAPGNGLRA